MRLLLAASLITTTVFLAQTQSTYAAAITVNTTEDELNADGDCSLREAIEAANTDSTVDACPAGQFASSRCKNTRHLLQHMI